MNDYGQLVKLLIHAQMIQKGQSVYLYMAYGSLIIINSSPQRKLKKIHQKKKFLVWNTPNTVKFRLSLLT